MHSEKISILIVDDHALVRAGVTRILVDEPDLLVIGEASSGEKAIEFVTMHMPDIVIMDARMPGIGGIEATHRLLAMYPDLKIIAISAVVSGAIPSQMLRAGARSFLTKNVSVDELCKAIRMVQSGQRYVTPDVATQMAVDPFNKNGGSLFDKLSRREMQIAQMLTDGKKVSRIAEYLSLSPKTVYSYRYRIFEKLGIHSDVELTILAVKHGLADDARELDELPRFSHFAG
jgi:DNA-binding NarL/FixJ family response regulator